MRDSTNFGKSALLRWSSKWWPGTIPLAILWALAAWTSTSPLETELASRSNAALKNILLDKSRITVSGRDVTLAADAFSEQGRHSAVAAIAAVPGVRLVDDETRLLPAASPFVWSAERDVVRLTLTGSSPMPASKAKLLQAARADLGGVEVVDQTNLARGAPAGFDEAALLLLAQVPKLKDGKITITDTKVGLSGMARELGGREAIAAALKNLPAGFSVAANDIKAPPYVFQAYKDPVARTLTLTGNAPDSNAHAAIVAAASRKFFNEKVVDKLQISLGAPYGFINAAVPALGALSRLSTGTLVFTDREIKLSGDALYDAAVAQLRANLTKELPQSFQLKADVTVKPASSPVDATVCQQLFSELLGKGTIRFEPKRSSLDPDSADLLDHLVETALRCPTAHIDVAGHTDGDGDNAANQALSAKRAQAVVDYLVKAGLPASRFTAVGYGSTQPIAANDNDEGKARNRRIEFIVKEQQP